MGFRVGFRPRVAVGFVCDEESRTIQDPRDECDINLLMAKYRKTGMITHLAKYPPRYEDVSDAVTYQEALNIVGAAEYEFMKLSAEIRARFGNDPGKFLEFVGDPDNVDEMIKLGLAVKREPVDPIEVKVTNPVPKEPASDPGAK